MGVIKDIVQDYGENCTTHGIPYILQRDQSLIHRVLWLIVVFFGIGLAVQMSLDAYQAWEDDPIITTVSTTALPIHDLEYPAITICGQGMATDTLDKVLKERFESWLREKDIDAKALSTEEVDVWKKKYDQESFPGLEVPMEDVTAMMTAPDPGAAVGAKAISNAAAGSLSQLRGGCSRGWVSSTTKSYLSTTYCYKALEEKMDFTSAKFACQRQRSILLEFDTRAEVDDFQRLVEDEHIGVTLEDEIWLGATYKANESFLYQYNQIDAELMLGLNSQPQNGQNCASFNSTTSKLDPRSCNSTRLAVCTTAAHSSRRKRRAEIYEEYDNETIYRGNRKRRYVEDPKFDVFLNPEKKSQQKETLKNLTLKFQKVFKSMDMRTSYPALFQVLWHSVNPCFDIQNWTSSYRDQKSTIKRCKWKGVDVNCSAIFKTNPTDRGMCCTFNALAAEKIYQESKFSEAVAQLQKQNVLDSFEHPVKLPDGFDTGSEPSPEIGKNRGLTLIIDSHSNILSPSTVSDDFEGFMSIVNSRSKFPSLFEKGFVIRPGHENLVAMGAVSTIADDEIISVPAKKRNCYFQEEYKLELHRLYSQSGCVFECKMAMGRAKTIGGCTPWFYPSKDTNMCDPWQTKIFLSAILGGSSGPGCAHCLSDCVSTTYTSSVSATPLRRCDTKNIGMTMLCKFDGDVPLPAVWSYQVLNEYKKSYPEEELPDFLKPHVKDNSRRQFLQKTKKQAIFEGLYANKEDNYYNAFEKDIAVVHFFFQEPTVFQFRRSLRMTSIDFISQMGGLLGLFLGFSLISGIEIVYWFTLRLGQRLCCNKTKNSTLPIPEQQKNYSPRNRNTSVISHSLSSDSLQSTKIMVR